MATRLTFVIGGFFVFYVAVIFNLYNIQIEHGNYYVQRAEAQNKAAGFLEPRRGGIFFTDKNDNPFPAAINKEYPLIYVVPKEIEDAAEAANILAPALKIDPGQLEKTFSKIGDPYELLVKKADESMVGAVRSANLKGIYVAAQFSRFYPLKNIASQLIGFTAPTVKDDNPAGRYGLEAKYNDSLAGTPGDVVGDRVVNPRGGEDLVTTIDPTIQSRASTILEKLVNEYHAAGGTAIVENPKTGEILAMESYPNFDPNNYGEAPISSLLNPAVESVYEPGSIFKLITMAAGIDTGKITPETTYYDNGSVIFNGRTIKNWASKVYGVQTMTQVIEQSINTGAVFAERQTGHKNFLEYLKRFGVNGKTAVDLPGEVSGNLKNLEDGGRDINFANASFGQGIAVTPLNLLRSIAAIANDGVMMRPYINRALGPQEVGRIISGDTARKVREMMVSAVNKNIIAVIPNYSVAGKTGTAQVPDFEHGGYTDQVINTYVGFAPAFDPRFIVLLKLDRPEGAPLAGLTVVPAFRELAEFLLNYYNIAPDRL